ncbi:lysophospholipid acyltransferase family protein [Gluconobacter kanchanaburiensis]|uniref:Lipid A biosynthesis lauroyl acyltransferase n=1 Tax=Gluconobacter kanchanaburiensis NBRC 103587 TaxID=1307948 RepID=A0A511B8V4_9PROT|nr:lysophospholipid acyltransferase family protein [Gluconobacter kanchanaburiensis]MBF0860629.1 lysophospholipid acyltransferase family protein [Gluconobacter kanchanaburiensis]GBR69499.1 lipid A biosynthesis lauroyl acyltransferase [Gluconobacter kanchanaburiensis NBRC 103587]GEK96112.1 lipid A biosynthesis lauroyl acyltransferase [Gluconobacter kanchanaburiensis NBRC 103587]
MTSLLSRAETLIVRSLLALVRSLPPATASNLGGGLARLIGPLLPVSKIADHNLQLALPEYGPSARKQIVRECWDNLGRTVAEFPHIGQLQQDTLSGPGWSVEGAEHLETARLSGRPIIFFSGHIGNWELMPPVVARYGMPFASFYRAASNPGVDGLIHSLRQDAMGQTVPMFPKGARGARSALKYLAGGGHLGVLGDQKMNDGIEARLFGRPAMTASAAAVFALRHDALVVTGHVRRDGPARLVLVVDAPFLPEKTGNRTADTQALTQIFNDRLESWIRAIPGSWLWLHRRWDKSLYRDMTTKR